MWKYIMTLTDEQKAEISLQRSQTKNTIRATAKGIESHLFKAYEILDHGFVRVIDYMGDDTAVVQAARVSYGQGTKKSRDDSGLIKYLMKNWHSTPFEMCEIKLHVKLPVFVARQWIRHRTANVNEYSARYSILDKEFYIPEPDKLASQSESNAQGRGNVLTNAEAESVLKILKNDSNRLYANYEEMLSKDGKQGLARELARMNLPMNIYTQWYWKTNLHNLFHFLRLRADTHAQYEIRVYADLIMKIVEDWVPISFAAFKAYRLESVQLSSHGVECLRRMLKQEEVSQENSGMSKGEWSEFCEIFKKNS